MARKIPLYSDLCILLFVLLTFTIVADSYAQEKLDPVSLVDITTQLTEKRLGLPTILKIIAKRIRDDGVSFEIDDEIEKDLRSRGADDELIETIRLKLCDVYTEKARECADDAFSCKVDAYTKALSFHADDWTVLAQRGRSFLSLRNEGQASLDFRRAEENAPSNPDVYFYHGTGLSDIEQYDDAIKYLSKSIELNKKYSAAYYNRALAYENTGKVELAIADYSRYIQLEPKDIDGYKSRGNLFLDLDNKKAISDFNAALAIDPKDSDSNVGLGRAKIGDEKYDDAIKYFDKALELDPRSAYAFHNRAYTFFLKNDFEAAIQDYDRSIAIDPSAGRFLDRGNAYYGKGAKTEALEDFNRALDLEPNNYDGLIARGEYYADAAEYEKAIIDFESAIRIDGTKTDGYFDRGYTLIDLNSFDAAVADFTKVIELDPKNSAAYTNRGMAYFKSERK